MRPVLGVVAGLGAAVKAAAPEPLPPEVPSVIQFAPVETVQAQPVVVTTPTLDDPPFATMVPVVAARL